MHIETAVADITREYKYVNYAFIILMALSIFFFTSTGQKTFSFFQINTFNCFHMDVTGQPCKTCGMTRALRALFAGDYHSAIKFHSKAPLIFVLLIVELGLRLLPLLNNHVFIPWFDMTQLTAVSLISLIFVL